MNFEEAVERYFHKHCAYAVKEGRTYANFDVRHEEGWSNDSGTHWPASTYITYREQFVGAKGQKHNRKKEVFAREDDPVEFMRALFEED